MEFYRKLEFTLGVAILAVITGLVFIAAVMRFYGTPLIWSVDLAQLLFIWLCFIGATKALRERAHLGVDLFVRLLGSRVRLLIETVLALITLAFLAVLAKQGYGLTMLNLERQYGDSGLSYAWVTIAVPIGALMLSVVILTNLAEAWRKRGNTLIFTRDTEDLSQRSEL